MPNTSFLNELANTALCNNKTWIFFFSLGQCLNKDSHQFQNIYFWVHFQFFAEKFFLQVQIYN